MRIAWPGSVEDEEVDLEACCVDKEGENDEAGYSRDPVFDVRSLLSAKHDSLTHNWHGKVSEFLP